MPQGHLSLYFGTRGGGAIYKSGSTSVKAVSGQKNGHVSTPQYPVMLDVSLALVPTYHSIPDFQPGPEKRSKITSSPRCILCYIPFNMKRYSYNTSVFTSENQISYYLLGVLMTDGSMRSNALRVELTSKDEDWINLISNLVAPNKPIIKRRNAFICEFNNSQIYNWLLDHGCTPKKSLTIKFPTIPKEYLRDFVRGCWDGDGHICTYMHKKRIVVEAAISSASQFFIDDFSDCLSSLEIQNSVNKSKLCNSVIDNRIIVAKNNLWRMKLGKHASYNLCNFMYYKDCFCMPRKQNKYLEVFKLFNNGEMPF